MSREVDKLLKRPDIDEAVRPQAPQVVERTLKVRAVTQEELDREIDDEDLLKQVGLDANVWQVKNVRRSNWQGGPSGEWLESLKVSAVRREKSNVDHAEISNLKDQISVLDPIVVPKRFRSKEKSTFVVALADFQAGKSEGGGAEATVIRVTNAVNEAVKRLYELMSAGRKPERIALVGLGDLVEGCTGFFAGQEWSTELTRREQVNVVRRLLLRILREFTQFELPITMATCAGNHGEHRKNGKSFTTLGDNDDVAVFEQLYDIVSVNPKAFGRVDFVIPGDDLTACIQLSGVNVGIAHGHQAKVSGSPQAKLFAWWKNQIIGNQPVGDARILLTGHYHHFSSITYGTRTHFQTPAMDGGSQWFTETSGIASPSGMLTMLVGDGISPLGWSDVQIV